MKLRIIQTITNTLDENRKQLKTVTREVFRLTPDSGKLLVNNVTGEKFDGTVSVSPESEIANYSEIDVPEEDED